MDASVVLSALGSLTAPMVAWRSPRRKSSGRAGIAAPLAACYLRGTVRRFLYLTPYFPPMTRVGAMRPLKFVRHLPRHGWSPVVLCDLHRVDDVSEKLLDFVPAETVVIRDYGPSAASSERSFERGELTLQAGEDDTPRFLGVDPDWVVLPHAIRATRRALAKHPECEAIMVNADPYATMLVGARLARWTGLPLILDLRDPWAWCSLRRARRSWVERRFLDFMERRVFSQADAVILNTRTALDDYLPHYTDLGSERFHVIRNHGDPDLMSGGVPHEHDRFTILFMGRFRRYVEGTEVVDALARVRQQGITGAELQLLVSGDLPESLLELAEARGVADMLKRHPFVPYNEIGTFMDSADLLLAVSNATAQRVPAKIYDYATTRRPILVVADNPELAGMMEQLGGAEVLAMSDVEGLADAIVRAFRAGRGREVERADLDLGSAAATAKLAGILDSVTSRSVVSAAGGAVGSTTLERVEQRRQ